MVNQIRYMCTAFKDRTGGSTSEHRCMEHMENELRGHVDRMDTQPIAVHPAAGWAWAVIVASLGIAGIVLPLFNTRNTFLVAAGFVVSALAIAVTFFQFILGYPLLDRLFPKKAAKNVFATVKPQGETRKRIVFTGHADAAYEMTYSHRGGAKKVFRVALSALFGLAIVFLLNTVLFIRHLWVGAAQLGSVWYWLRLISLPFLPALMEGLFFFNVNRVVDGANDNLSGCVVAMATVQELASAQSRLEHTEVCCLITSSEECGLRGASAFGKAFAQEADDIDTVFVVLDTLHDVEQLQVYTRGMNGFQQNSQEVASVIQQSAQAIGLTLTEADSFIGATDAEALSRAGLKACALCGVDHTPQPYYHTRADNVDSIDESCLRVCLEICLGIARQCDESLSQDEDNIQMAG